MLQNLPDYILKAHAVEFKKFDTVDEMHSVINMFQFDNKTGFPRGQHGPGLYITENSTETEEVSNTNGAGNAGGWGSACE